MKIMANLRAILRCYIEQWSLSEVETRNEVTINNYLGFACLGIIILKVVPCSTDELATNILPEW
jgi:hypothetical protein